MSPSKPTNGPLVYILAVVAVGAVAALGVQLFSSPSASVSPLIAPAPILLPASSSPPAPAPSATAAEEARPQVPPVIEGGPRAATRGPSASPVVAAVRDSVTPAPAAPAAPALVEPAPPATRPTPKPQVAASKPTVAPAPAAKGLVRLVDTALATTVVDREPVGAGTSFSLDGDKVWAWVKVDNAGPPSTITMVWRKGEEVAFRYELKVGQSKDWRTWSRKTLRKGDAGDWAVDVLDADGALLSTLHFTITAAATTAG